jgi:protein-tyrosine phosphatase
LSSLRARTLEPEDFERFDLILAMDDDNLRELRDRVPAGQEKRIRLVMDFADAATRRTIPDPYYGGPHGFEEVLDLLEEAAQGLLEHVRQRGRAVR